MLLNHETSGPVLYWRATVDGCFAVRFRALLETTGAGNRPQQVSNPDSIADPSQSGLNLGTLDPKSVKTRKN